VDTPAPDSGGAESEGNPGTKSRETQLTVKPDKKRDKSPSPSDESPEEGRKPIIMVSSTVDGIEDLLEQIFAILSAEFTVWMSYKGTVPVDSKKSNFENCLDAVKRCDLFLGIITTSYGSGKDGAKPSITHQEVRAVLKRDIPRWFLAHRDVELAYDLIRNLGHRIPSSIPEINERMKKLRKSGRHPVIGDYRVLEMYAEVIQAKKQLSERRGNWAQPFATAADGRVFVVSQFLRYSRAVEDVEKGPLSALRHMAREKDGSK